MSSVLSSTNSDVSYPRMSLNAPRLSYKLTLSDFAEPSISLDFAIDEELPLDVTDVDRAVADAIRQEAAKKAHDGSVSAKMYRAAKIYFDHNSENRDGPQLDLQQAKQLCWFVRAHFRGAERVEQDVYHTETVDDILDEDAGVAFVRKLIPERFGWAVWSNLDFMYRVVLYDGILVLGEGQSVEDAKTIAETFCIGYLVDLPTEFEHRRLFGDYHSLQFMHDESENAPKIDVLFEFYRTEKFELTGEAETEKITHSHTELGPPKKLEHRQISVPKPNISDVEREEIVSNHPARAFNHRQRSHGSLTSGELPPGTKLQRAARSDDGVTVVRIDTFQQSDLNPVGKAEEKEMDEHLKPGLNHIAESDTSGFYEDSDMSVGARPKAQSVDDADGPADRKQSFSQTLKGLFRRRSAPQTAGVMVSLDEDGESAASRPLDRAMSAVSDAEANREPPKPRRRRQRSLLRRGRNSCTVL